MACDHFNLRCHDIAPDSVVGVNFLGRAVVESKKNSDGEKWQWENMVSHSPREESEA
jgi:hypothetical protein